MKKLTKTQIIVAKDIDRECGVVVESRECGDLIYSTLGGRRINARTFKCFVRDDVLVKQNDGLFGDSQTYKLNPNVLCNSETIKPVQ